MGFSLLFLCLEGDRQVDGDRGGVRQFLAQRGLHHQGDQLVDPTGAPLTFDQYPTDLTVSDPDSAERLSGGVSHAHLGAAECEFIYNLCVAGRFVIANPQCDPLLLVPGSTHMSTDLPSDVKADEVAWVDSPDQLACALAGNFQQFCEYKDHVAETVAGQTDS